MDILLLGITIVSLIVAFVMSITSWRLTRDEKQRSAARIAALSAAAADDRSPAFESPRPAPVVAPVAEAKPLVKAPWSAPKIAPAPSVGHVARIELPLNEAPRVEAFRGEPALVTHATGFLGATDVQHEGGNRQKSLAFAAVVLFLVLSGGLVWMMSGPRGSTAVAMGPNAPLELVSLTHERHDAKLAVSGLVRNPVNGKSVDHLSAVVFLFDRMGTFITSARANVDFLKLGAGDESPFVVSLDAPSSVARYRVSFRTDDGVVPHVDRRGSSPADAVGIQQSAVKSSVDSPQ